MITAHNPSTSRSRHGVILVIVLVVIAMLALSAYTFSNMMLAERQATQTHGDMAQSHALVQSGVAAIGAFLMQDAEVRRQLGGTYDNPGVFQAQVVVASEAPGLEGLFSVMAPEMDGQGISIGVRYGLQNESAKLNLNQLLQLVESLPESGPAPAAPPANGSSGDGSSGDGSSGSSEEEGSGDPARDILLALPGMTDEIADAILDWIDEDDEPREFGAEIETYSSMVPPYQPRNGPLATLDELLLVRGVTPDLLFGRDRNRNGLIDESEYDRVLNAEIDPSLGSLDLGWSAYLTLVSQEKLVDPTGSPRIDLNADDLQQLYSKLAAALNNDQATFIIAYRQNGTANSDEQGENVGGRTVDLTQPGKTKINSPLDLIGALVNVRFEGEDKPALVESPWTDEADSLSNELPRLLDYVTTETEQTVMGRINVNLAPRPVLQSIPGMTEDILSAIVAQQSPETEETEDQRRHPTWLLAMQLVDLDTMRELYPYLTSGGDVYRAQVVGHFGDGKGVTRAEIVIDATRVEMPLLLWKDMSRAGRGFDTATLSGQRAP